MGRNAGIPGLILFVCGIIGLILAVIEYALYTEGWIVDMYITSQAELTGLMGVTVLIWIVIGAVMAALSQ
jgi:hypothetical protein